MAIEVVTGKDLETYYRENIFEPLGIKEITSSPICQPCRSSCCKPMRGEKGEILRLCSFSCPAEEEMEASYPGAGLFADGAEYVKLLVALLNQGTHPEGGYHPQAGNGRALAQGSARRQSSRQLRAQIRPSHSCRHQRSFCWLSFRAV